MPPKVICVVGPTASGKTKMGVALAKTFDGEVVSVDSMQIYRGMAIGTAAPTPEETEGIPHHMVGVADPRESWSVARFTEEADACVQDILRRGKRPVLVGGTGLYLDSLVRGGDFAPGRSGGAVRERLQRELAERGAPAMLECLREVDPESAARLHLRDEKRILRALEVYEETGETITAHNRRTQERPPRYDALYIGLDFADRADLRARIDRRVDEMVRQGLLQEAGGAAIDETEVRRKIWELAGGYDEERHVRIKGRYDCRSIAYDPYRMSGLSLKLKEVDEHELFPFRQGFLSMAEPTAKLEADILEHRLRHFGNPVLTWMVSNAKTQTDPKGNTMLAKENKDSKRKIDGVVASVMAYGVYLRPEVQELFNDDYEVRTL